MEYTITIRDLMFPDLGDNTQGQCITCGSDTADGNCPRQCDDYSPNYHTNLVPMDFGERARWHKEAKRLV